MTTDHGTTAPGDGRSVSIVDTVCGTVVRTPDAVGFVAAARLRRLALRDDPEGIVVLDARATCTAAPVVVGAVADLAAGLRARGGLLRIVRSPQTPPAVVGAAGAPAHDSLAEALGCRSCAADAQSVDPPARPPVRRPPANGGRGGMDPARSPLPQGAPVRIHPALPHLPRPRRPERG
ncbi:hypothetical protein [Actinomycetospora atypica]|uniref:STAS domain-containing protein n=1 Tax=Actinomycetospora atypica TaxID=1290095 RepID=A0ABV9YTV2_9PSEU